MDYTPNMNAQGMRQPLGPVGQPNWNGGPRYNTGPQVKLSEAMKPQKPIIPINGRIVDSEQDIMPAEIPMDGSICLFMTSDCKSIIAKQWDSNGTLQSIIYEPSAPAPKEQSQNCSYEGLKEQLDRIEGMLKRDKSRFKEAKKNAQSVHSTNGNENPKGEPEHRQ